MAIVAGVGLLASLITYEVIFALNPLEPRASISWFLTFTIGVVRQHWLHRRWSFTYYAPYWLSLRRACIADGGAAIVSTTLNWTLTAVWKVNHRIAWLACVLTVAALNYFLLKRYVFRR